MSPPRALVLAAGRGDRLRPVTDAVPKCLVPIGGRTLLDYWLIRLGTAGVRQIVVNTHHLHDIVRRYITTINRRGGQALTESFEPRLLGSAGTISANRDLADGAEDLFVIYGDNHSGVDLAAMLDFHRQRRDAAVTMMLFRTANPRECGIAQMAEDGRIVAFEEKPPTPRGNLASAGVFVMTAAAFREIADLHAFDLGHDVLPRFVSRMQGWIYAGPHTDIGTPERYAHACLQATHVNRLMSLDATGLRPAVFLHRDGVLVEPRAAGAERPRLVPAAAQTVLALRRGGYACIILAAADAPRSFDDRVCEAFAAEGVVFDAVRRYPVVLTRAGVASEAVVATAMSATAADLKLDLARSWRVDAHSADVAGVPGALRVCVAAGHRTGNPPHPSVTACGDFAGLLTSLGNTCVARREASA